MSDKSTAKSGAESETSLDPDAFEARAATMGRGEAATLASPDLTGKQRRHLRGLGHPLKPTVIIGHHGLTSGVAEAASAALETHELIKVKLLDSAPNTMKGTALWMHEAVGAQCAQIVGKTLLFYRAREKKPTIKLP